MNEICPIFFGNEPDNNHCLQAASLIVLNTLGHKVDFAKIDELTGYEAKRYTWSVCGAVVLARLIKGTKLLSEWDYSQFAAKGEAYLIEKWDPSWFQLQRQHASPNFAKEQEWARLAVEQNTFELGGPSVGDIEKALLKNFVIALVNAPRLYDSPGESGHFVVLFGFNNGHFYLHDPGLPAKSAQKIHKQKFAAAFRKEMILVPHPGFSFGLHTNLNAKCYCLSGKKFKECHGV